MVLLSYLSLFIHSLIFNRIGLGIKDVNNFDFMDPPNKDSLTTALRQLSLLGALDLCTTGARLTKLGEKMAGFPLDPR